MSWGLGSQSRSIKKPCPSNSVTRPIPFAREAELPICYKTHRLDCYYKADFVCYGEVITELKALDRLSDIERSQVLNYLKASGLSRALLINFGTKQLGSAAGNSLAILIRR